MPSASSASANGCRAPKRLCAPRRRPSQQRKRCRPRSRTIALPHHLSTLPNEFSLRNPKHDIMSNVNFTDIQKQAIVSLIVEMINADRVITIDELVASNTINRELGITQELFLAGKAMDFDYALEVVKQLAPEPKRFVAQQLVRIIDADGPDTAELDLLDYIARATGLDQEL